MMMNSLMNNELMEIVDAKGDEMKPALEDAFLTGEQIVDCVRMSGEHLRKTMEVADEMKAVADLLPESSLLCREKLILDSENLDVHEKLEALYTSDTFELKRVERMNAIANSNRDNRIKNSAIQFMCYAAPMVLLLAVPSSRRAIVKGLKWMTKTVA